jgi:hypothetical protein
MMTIDDQYYSVKASDMLHKANIGQFGIFHSMCLQIYEENEKFVFDKSGKIKFQAPKTQAKSNQGR